MQLFLYCSPHIFFTRSLICFPTIIIPSCSLHKSSRRIVTIAVNFSSCPVSFSLSLSLASIVRSYRHRKISGSHWISLLSFIWYIFFCKTLLSRIKNIFFNPMLFLRRTCFNSKITLFLLRIGSCFQYNMLVYKNRINFELFLLDISLSPEFTPESSLNILSFPIKVIAFFSYFFLNYNVLLMYFIYSLKVFLKIFYP